MASTRVHPEQATACTARTAPGGASGVWRLWLFAVFGGLGQSLAGVAGGLLIAQVAGSDALAGLPQAMLVLGAGGAAVGLSRVAAAHGRAVSLTTGCLVAVVGCGLVVAGAVLGLVPLLLAGTLLLGAGQAAVMLARYAGHQLQPARPQAAAFAAVLAATTIGAVAGPNLLAVTARGGERLGLPALAGAFVVVGAALLAAAVVMRGLRRRLARPESPPGAQTRAVTRMTRQSWAGVCTLAVANLVMSPS